MLGKDRLWLLHSGIASSPIVLKCDSHVLKLRVIDIVSPAGVGFWDSRTYIQVCYSRVSGERRRLWPLEVQVCLLYIASLSPVRRWWPTDKRKSGIVVLLSPKPWYIWHLSYYFSAHSSASPKMSSEQTWITLTQRWSLLLNLTPTTSAATLSATLSALKASTKTKGKQDQFVLLKNNKKYIFKWQI